MSGMLSSLASPTTMPDPQLQTGTLSGLANIPKRSAFAPGGVGRSIAGYIGDALLQASGHDPLYAKTMQDQQDAALKHLLLQSEVAKAMRGPDPHYFQDNAGDEISIDGDGVARKVYQNTTPKTTYLTAANGKGQTEIIPIINGVPMLDGNLPNIGGIPQSPPTATSDPGMTDLPSGFTVRKGGTAKPGATFPGPVSGAR